MKDYKRSVHIYYARSKSGIPRARRALPAPKKTVHSQGGYHLKFITVIVLTIASSYYYVTYQIKHNPQSVFTEIKMLFQDNMQKKIAIVKTIEKKARDGKKTSSAESKRNSNIQDQNRSDNQRTSVTEPTRNNKRPGLSLSPAESAAVVKQTENKVQKKETAVGQLYTIYLPDTKVRAGSVVLSPVDIEIRGAEINQADIDSVNTAYFQLIKNLVGHKSGLQNLPNEFSPGTEVRRVWLENDVLLVDFNRRFEYSRFGHTGLQVQIQQILWTVFMHDTQSGNMINRVSFLIDGRRKEKIGGEGVALKLFYSRNDLRKIIQPGGSA